MKYTVFVTVEAARELEEAYDWLAAQTEHAAQWYNGLLDAILSLEEMPGRCPLARDREKGDEETRQLVYGDKRHGYLIFFEIRGETVVVEHIRHGARGVGDDG